MPTTKEVHETPNSSKIPKTRKKRGGSSSIPSKVQKKKFTKTRHSQNLKKKGF